MAILLALALLTPSKIPTIQIDRSVVLRTFDPQTAFGAGIDGHEAGESAEMLNPETTTLMKSMGVRSLTYRLRTELGVEVWHWNPEGTWSDAAHKQGYWTSSATNSKPIWLTNGYRLPRRGDTLDQANRDDYSRLDDGDPNTFWKSNPYLDPSYTGVTYEKSPQWIVLVWDKPQTFNELRLNWAKPYAKKYTISYLADEDSDKSWVNVKGLTLEDAETGHTRDRFKAFTSKFIKIDLQESSGTAPAGSKDKRDIMGFAVREIEAGFTDAQGHFKDSVIHAKKNTQQTMIYVSSTDPWHRAQDKDKRTEQPGFDFILARGLDQGQSVLVPTGCLYDTPENVANEALWLKNRGVKLRGIELGEEPDGNWVYAEHYAMLYLQMADAVKSVMPNARLGGPSFQTVLEDYAEFPRAGKAWLTRFKDHLRERGRLDDYKFASFEWYPFDNVKNDPAKQLPKAPGLMRHVLKRLRSVGMQDMPWYITEFGWSAYAGPAEITSPGGVFDFEVAMTALEEGCETSYQYGWESNEPIQEVPGSWGNIMAILSTKRGLEKLPTYWSTWLLTHKLCALKGQHQLLRTTGGDSDVGAYAVRQPNGRVALALLNRSNNVRLVSVANRGAKLAGIQYGQPQFIWNNIHEDSKPQKNLPPVRVKFAPGSVRLTPFSITIVEVK